MPKNLSQELGLIAMGVVQAQLESLAVEDLWTLVAVILIVIIYRVTLAEPVAIQPVEHTGMVWSNLRKWHKGIFT